MRTVINLLGGHPKVLKPFYVEGRKKPLYYSDGKVSVIGHYESPCGGVDTISGYNTLMNLVRERADVGHVLMEGLLLSEDSKQTILHLRNRPLRVLYLNTPLETCIERIKGRRAARGNEKPLNETNTRNRYGVILRTRARLEAAEIICQTVTCDQAPKLIMQWLNREDT